MRMFHEAANDFHRLTVKILLDYFYSTIEGGMSYVFNSEAMNKYVCLGSFEMMPPE